ncbi:MAG: Flp pilus assembly complex ATPase component TadA [Betaproteobacteria bacterium]|nr:Flp pilus assembly complex ATPase component TadA [Betaproteobacteria bacterium]
MSSFAEEQARDYMHKLLATMLEAGGSDLFIAADFPPSIKAQGRMAPLTNQKLPAEVTRQLAESMMNERQRAEFAKELECNFAISLPGLSRFRVNVLLQQQNVGMVMRTIPAEIPDFDTLGLPEILEVVSAKRGLMEHAIAFAETGHLCLGTLHANSANQTIERIINFFPEERRNQLLMDLSANLRAIVSQRLVRTVDGKGRRAAIEILINTPTIAERIFKGEFQELKDIMGKSRELGMRTFDWALFDLYNEGAIAYEEAIRNADSANELRLAIKLKSPRGEPGAASGLSLEIHAEAEPTPAETEIKRKAEMERQQAKRVQVERERLVRAHEENKRAQDRRHEQEDRELAQLKIDKSLHFGGEKQGRPPASRRMVGA